MRMLLSFLLLFISIFAYSQKTEPATGKISAAEIIQKSLIATGQQEGHQRLQSLAVRGNFGIRLDHPQGHFEVFYKAPSSDVLLLTNDVPKWEGTIHTGHREGQRFSAYPHASAGPPPDTPSTAMEIIEEDWLSVMEGDYSLRYEKIELIGQEEIDKKLAYAVRFTPRQGDQVVRYYDRETFLLVGMDQVLRFRRSKDGSEAVYRARSFFRNYRDQDGLKLPRVVAVKKSWGELLFGVTKIQPDPKIDESVFQ